MPKTRAAAAKNLARMSPRSPVKPDPSGCKDTKDLLSLMTLRFQIETEVTELESRIQRLNKKIEKLDAQVLLQYKKLRPGRFNSLNPNNLR